MGAALIVDGGVATVATGPALTTVTAGADSSFTVRNASLTSGIQLMDAWRDSAHVGRVQITSPKLVPVSNGIRLQTPSGLADFLLPGPPFQALTPQDTLTVQDDGTAADVDAVCIQTWYDDLASAGMVLKMPGDISGQTDFVFGWPVAATSSSTAGDQNSTVITTTVDSSTANRWYAVLGILTDVEVTALGIKGISTSQLFCGGPGDANPTRMRNYFADLSMRSGKPCVPLFNAADKANTNIALIDQAASTAINATLILAQLTASYQP